MQTIKKNIDTLSILYHMLDSAKERITYTEIDPNYKAILEKAIPNLEEKIRNLKASIE